MRYSRTITIAVVLLFAVTGLAVGQNFLTDNPYYEEAQELRREAEQAIDDGEYDRAVELAQEAQELTRQAREWAEEQLLRYQANAWTNRAEERLQFAERVDAEERYPEEYENATQFYEEAESLFEEEEYEDSIQASRNVISALQSVRAVSPSDDVKPRYYIVRLIPERRDCFWRIAEYEFIYDDPWQWRRIHEANRDKIPEPDNPDLIEPGTVLYIPSIDGETRRGTYQPPEN
jgi:nucleoid-associated protein YgaU